jgi:hypothetical protein
MPAIVESWYPRNNDTYGVLLEDDIEVSPLFYGWLKWAILKYRYSRERQGEGYGVGRMFGISLYQPKNLELRLPRRVKFDVHEFFKSVSLPSTTPYLSQVPCSWGAAFFPEHWKEFHSYLSLRLSEISIDLTEKIVPDIKSNSWHASWKRYFNELIYLRGYSMLYPNYPEFVSFSTNHLEKGTHVKNEATESKRKAFGVPLMGVIDSNSLTTTTNGLKLSNSLLDDMPTPDQSLPHFSDLPVLDLWGYLTTGEDLVQRGEVAVDKVGSCPSVVKMNGNGNERQGSSGDEGLSYNARELLCERRHAKVKVDISKKLD